MDPVDDTISAKFDLLIKIVVVGDSGVGKTSLLERYITNEFEGTHKPTIGVDSRYKLITKNGKRIKVHFFDTAGQERFYSLTSQTFNGSHGAVLVFDITKRNSFQKLSYWFDKINESCGSTINKILIGNKIDMLENREVSYDDAKKYAEDKDVLYLETSALTNQNDCVQVAFNKIIDDTIDEILKNQEELEQVEFREARRTTLTLKRRPENKEAPKKKCC